MKYFVSGCNDAQYRDERDDIEIVEERNICACERGVSAGHVMSR